MNLYFIHHILKIFMKKKFISLYTDIATRVAEMSSARRLKVGAIVVKNDRIISLGYNGTPAGWDNNCEDEIVETYSHYEGTVHKIKLVTKPEVLHAESNAIAKLARNANSGLGAELFVTHSPCIECAKLIYQSGMERVWFNTAYRSNDGIEFLEKSGIEVIEIKKGEVTCGRK